MSGSKIVKRLYEYVREQSPGGCKALSLGDDCECPLCDIDRLAALEAKVDQLRALLPTAKERRALDYAISRLSVESSSREDTVREYVERLDAARTPNGGEKAT